MTRLCNQHHGVNLAQGFPDFAAPEAIKAEAARAVQADINQYAITWGAKRLRDALVAKTERFTSLRYDPETEVTVCCGSTECMISTLLALVNPGEEVIVFEPFYENYGPDAILCGATPRFVRLREPDWSYDPAELEPEHLSALRLSSLPISVADLAADLDLPLGVVQILLSDLRERSLITIHHPIPPARLPDPQILKEVVDGLRRL